MEKYFHVIINKENIGSDYVDDFIKFISIKIKPYFNYKIHFIKKDENILYEQSTYEEVFLWDFSLVKIHFDRIENSQKNHVVVLDHKTDIFNNIESKNTAVDENFIIFNNIKCIYLHPENNEIHYDYDLIVNEDNYIYDIDSIIKDKTNIQ